LAVLSVFGLRAAEDPAKAVLEARAKKALAVLDGTLKAPGLEKPVMVLRDRWGVPHIYAESQHDLFFAQGFVAAQDRLFQMELWKRAGQGRLAEILGPTLLFRDVNARLLRYRGSMDAEWTSYAPDARGILTAFTDGINAFIASRGPESPAPLEFELAGFRPEPWKPEDCLSRMAGFPMTGNAVNELYHAALVAELGAEKASKLLDLDPKVMLDPAPGLDFKGLSPDLLKDFVGSDTRLEMAGSNNWVVSGKWTKNGKPLLANDPHRTMAIPSLRYVVHLVAPGWNVIGATEPALPGVAIGHNRRIAWGLTVFPIDQQDLYLEELDPADPNRYRTASGYEAMRVEKETVFIKGGLEAEVPLRFTRHGPVVWRDEASHRALALRWTGAEPGTAGYLGALSLDRAEDWPQFLAAMERWRLPAENMVYADTAGNIGAQSAGLAPVRKSFTGLLPVPGTGGFEWDGFVPFGDLPRVFNPASGWHATANDRTIPEKYPRKIGFQWASPWRVQRIRDELARLKKSGERVDTKDMARLQNDVTSLAAREFIALLGTTSLAGERDVQVLENWNGFLGKDTNPGVLYKLWMDELSREVMHRAAPESLWKLVEPRYPLALVLRSLAQPESDLFGEKPVEARDRVLRETLAAAIKRLNELRDADPAKRFPIWGSLHRMRFRHPLDRVPGGEALFDPSSVYRPGDGTTVNATGHLPRSFDQTAGASFREVIDLAEWDLSLAVNVPGQSGQPASPHATDLVGLWSDGGYFPLAYSRTMVEVNTTNRLLLTP
jgi:penicillin amidase